MNFTDIRELGLVVHFLAYHGIQPKLTERKQIESFAF